MDTNTEVKPEAVLSPAASSITRATTTVVPWRALEFNEEQIVIVRKIIAPPTATPAEVDFFIEWCRSTGLNPLLKQSFLVERWDTATNTKKHEPMAAEAGMAAKADSMPDFRGMKSGVVYAGDEFMVDEMTGEVTHRWSIEARKLNKEVLIGAWAHGKRDGRESEVTYVTLESRKPVYKNGGTSPFWQRDAAGQLRKCARADQYRRLYPNLFAGVYVEGELLEHEVEVNPAPSPMNATRGNSKLRDRLGVKTVDAAPAIAEAPKTGAPPIDCLRFGPAKGKKLIECTEEELVEAHKLATEQVAKSTGKEPWLMATREGIEAVDIELDRRKTPATEGERIANEPGSEG